MGAKYDEMMEYCEAYLKSIQKKGKPITKVLTPPITLNEGVGYLIARSYIEGYTDAQSEVIMNMNKRKNE